MLADRLHMSYDEVQEKTSSSQFVRWMVYLEEEINYFHREDHFWALLISVVHNLFAAKGKEKEPKDFLLKFKKDDSKKVTAESAEKAAAREEYEKNKLALSKAMWRHTINSAKNKKPKRIDEKLLPQHRTRKNRKK